MATLDPTNESGSDSHPPDPVGQTTPLRQARERLGLTLEQVAHETKIPLEKLLALERLQLSHGNCGFYERARLRAYARAVSLDEREVLAPLEPEAPPAAPPPVRQLSPAPRRSSRGRPIVTLVACGVMVAGISRVWESPDPGTESHTVPVAPSSQVERHAVPTTGSTPAVVQSTPLLAQLTPLVAVGESEAPGAEPRTQPTATVAPTELVITTEPADARVAVNGIGWGSTPITIKHLPPGEKQIRVTKDGYKAVERVTRVSADRSTVMDIYLQPAP